MKKLAITIGALCLLGCGPTLKFSGVGEPRPPKPPTCAITVFKAPPAEPYEELGTIDIQYGNTGFLTKLEDVMKTIQPEVCKAGGDGALAHANQYGTYLKATVLNLKPAKTAEPRVVDPDEREDSTGGAVEL